MLFCTQCGIQLFEGEVCECAEEKQFCIECGAKLSGGHDCGCTAREVPHTYTHSSMQIVSDYVSFMADEVPVKRYNITELRNLIRVTRAEGRLQLTSKRVIFRAEGRRANRQVHREFAISEIAGIDAVSKYRFSLSHFVIGFMTVLIAAVFIAIMTFMSGWAVTNLFVSRPPVLDFIGHNLEQIVASWEADVSQLSLIIGLVIGFGGAALYFLLRRKFWLRLLLLGASLGAFFVVGLTGNDFAYVLLGASALVNMYGLVMFAILPDLTVIVYGKSGTYVDMVRAKSGRAGIFGRAGTGYAEAAPTPEASEAICELGAAIADIQNLGDAGVEKWSM